MKKKISVLGCGWLGLPLAEALLKQGYQVAGSTTTPEKLGLLAAKGISPFLLDLRSPVIVPENGRFFQAEILVVAIPPGRGQENPYQDQIARLQKILLNSPVKQVLFVSSTGVYAPSSAIITEKSALDHSGAVALIAAEDYMLSAENPWKTTIVRFAGLFGPGREPGRFLAGKKDLPNPEAPVNLIHLEDCIGIISEIIKQEKWGEVFNACADEHPSRKVFYQAATRNLGLPEPAFVTSAEENKNGKWISNQKLKAALNYTFLYPDPLQAILQIPKNSTEIS
ncbi:SDR family oxidoreductase [Adhaeribacter soli]|uniref:SDR family oxidoreductase n=1 Tax=Adhaeribacter soli TaxID=2607655 RepID=A0A5N1J7X2_9BACT|nr:SDR family oxidoreductase [Adhaeribacter soli]KAA9346072.1 SDR family oxidoreductase [Adhaeribacter soli]